jgi:thiol-disulfide isomerase/thioredoxin
MSTLSKYRAAITFVGGVVVGAAAILVVFRTGGLTVVSQGDLDQRAQLITDLRQENQELIDDLFNYSGPDAVFDPNDLPYDADADASADVAAGRQTAVENSQFLMVTFGANWCVDCRTLHHHLKTDDVKAFTDDIFHFVTVDVGKFNRNRDVARELGVDLTRGIPVAVFFDPEGREIGNTNEGQLEPARFYTSQQILKFIRDIVERSLIAAPDSIE